MLAVIAGPRSPASIHVNGATTAAVRTAPGSSPRPRSRRPTFSSSRWPGRTKPARPTSIPSSRAAWSTVAARTDSFVALDAATGKQIWIHEGVKGFNSRGVNYWESRDGTDRRLIFSANNMLQEIDAQTGQTHCLVRREWPRRLARRPGSRPRDRRPAEPNSGACLRESSDPGIGHESGVRFGARRHSRVRRPHRRARLDLSHRAAAGRVRLRHVAGGCVEDCRRRQQLGRAVDRRGARHRLRPDGQPEVQFLRRQSEGRESLRRLPSRARRQDRQASVAFPDGPPRHLGSRQQLGAAVDHHPPQRPNASTSWRWPARTGTSTSSIASPASRSGQSRSVPCRSTPTFRARRCGPRSRFLRARRRFHARSSPSTI